VGVLLAKLLTTWAPSSLIWVFASWPALFTVIFSGLFIDGITAFPGPLSLVPIGSAVLLIISGVREHPFSASRLLGGKQISTLGKYGYSFYLWHWPVLVFIRQQPGVEIIVEGILVITISLLLAITTYHLVEKPFRVDVIWSASKLQRVVVARVVVVTSFSALLFVTLTWLASTAVREFAYQGWIDTMRYPGALIITEPEKYGRVPDLKPIPEVDLVRGDYSQVRKDGCVTDENSNDLKNCSYKLGNNLRVAIFGGSTTEHWFEVALHLAEKEGWTLVPVIKIACPPRMPEDARTEACASWLDSAYEFMRDGNFDLIITAATRPDETGVADYTPVTYQKMLGQLSSHSKVLAIRDNPRFLESLTDCYSRNENCQVDLFSRTSLENPTQIIRIPGVTFVDHNDLICPNNTCQPVVGNRFVFRDKSHLTRTYVDSLKEPLSWRWMASLEILE